MRSDAGPKTKRPSIFHRLSTCNQLWYFQAIIDRHPGLWSNHGRPRPRSSRQRRDPKPHFIKRLAQAEAIARKERFVARDVEEFEVTLPCRAVGDCLGCEGGLLSDVVVENASKKFLKDAGDPSDSVERVLIFHLFLLHHRSLNLYSYMNRGGEFGYRILGNLRRR